MSQRIAIPLACVITLFALLLILGPALARWKPEYASADPAIRNWYETRELTAAAQQRFVFKSCCNNSDVVKTQFHVDKSNGADEWFWLNDSKWTRIPDDVIHWNEHSPDGQAVLFAVGDTPTCFYPPDGGI